MLAKLSQSLSSFMRLVTWSHRAAVESFSLFRFSLFFGLDVNFPECLNALLEKKEIFVNLQNNDGKTALIYASENGHTYALNFLLENGADIDFQDKYGYTALMLATSKGSTEIVKALLEKGADINLQDENGSTSLDRFIQNGWKEIIVRVLINQDSLETYRDPRSKYGKKLLTQEALKLIDEKKKGLEKKSLFVRVFNQNISLKISSYLRMIDIIKLSQVSKKSKPIFFSNQEIIGKGEKVKNLSRRTSARNL